MPQRSRAWSTLTIAASVAIGAAISAFAAPQTPPARVVAVPDRFAQLLTKNFQFSASDLASVSRGTIVVKSLPTAEAREVAVGGAFWCDVPLDYFVARASNILTFKRAKEVQQIGLFGSPARVED